MNINWPNVKAAASASGNVLNMPGSKEELKKSTWDILDECGQVGVIIGDDCTVPNDIDDDRFNWVREACAEYAANH